MNTSIREHNLGAAALWGSGGRAYERISRSVSSAIEHCVERLNPVQASISLGRFSTRRVRSRGSKTWPSSTGSVMPRHCRSATENSTA